MHTSIKIHFYNGFNTAIENHYLQKEYRNAIIVQVNDLFYEVYFFTKDALEYEMCGDGFFSLPGIIILDEINNQKVITAIQYLSGINFFDSFTRYKENPINNSFAGRWYLNKSVFDSSELVVYELPANTK